MLTSSKSDRLYLVHHLAAMRLDCHLGDAKARINDLFPDDASPSSSGSSFAVVITFRSSMGGAPPAHVIHSYQSAMDADHPCLVSSADSF